MPICFSKPRSFILDLFAAPPPRVIQPNTQYNSVKSVLEGGVARAWMRCSACAAAQQRQHVQFRCDVSWVLTGCRLRGRTAHAHMRRHQNKSSGSESPPQQRQRWLARHTCSARRPAMRLPCTVLWPLELLPGPVGAWRERPGGRGHLAGAPATAVERGGGRAGGGLKQRTPQPARVASR